MKLPFTKMQAYGNDYIYINAIENEVVNPGLLSKKISDRHFGVGSDGLVLICASDVCDFRMRIFNPDGTEAEMCGNALRSTSKYVYDKGLTQKEQFTVETIGGIKRITLTVRDGVAQDIRADIGKPILEAAKIPVDTPKGAVPGRANPGGGEGVSGILSFLGEPSYRYICGQCR